MIDWRGHKVKRRDVVVLVSILPEGRPSAIVVVDPETGERRVAQALIIEGVGRPFIKYYESLVSMIDGVLQMDTPGPEGGVMICPVNLIYDMQLDNPNIVICIRGESDNAEDFFKDYYKPHLN